MSNTAIVSVKVPPQIFEEVRRSKAEIDWPEEIRAFIQGRLKELESARLLAEVHKQHKRRPSRPRGFADRLIREDRDGH